MKKLSHGVGRWVLGAAFLSLVAFVPGSQGSDSVTQDSIRSGHPLGGYVALWGDPFPALLGANLAYNVYDFVRLNAGVGTDSADRITATTFGLGAKVFIPNMPLSPILGANWSASTVSGGNADSKIRGLKQSGNRAYGTLGMDWQTTLGLNLGAGYNAAFNDIGGGTFYLEAGFYL